ncbi:MAG: 30S ribosomal protein S19 [Candidatus ainarchaeum sp.]|nr:30S ribosomal protein S19 [Candidatus ainarchaeum sp.]
MAKKEFSFRGKSLSELNEMKIEEFAELCTSRARKSLKKGFDKKMLKRIEKVKGKENPKPLKTHSRDLIVIPKMVGIKFSVHKGNGFEQVEITEGMLGHYLGEFAFTRKRLRHGKAGIGATRSSTAITAR